MQTEGQIKTDVQMDREKGWQMCRRWCGSGKPQFVSVWRLHKQHIAIITLIEETVPTQKHKPAVWVTGTTLID
ncbi:hypothetical protein ABVT39_022103 [Epinephelus coioides]